MAPRRPEREKLIDDLVAANPEAPARTLAQILHQNYPHEFETLEAARAAVRYRLGVAGKHNRAKSATKEFHRKPRKAGEFKLPKGLRQTKRPKKFKAKGRWLVLSDLHVPFHDEKAVEAAIRYGVDKKCEHVYINGDAVDFYKLSYWDKDPSHRDPDDEIEVWNEVRKILDSHFPGKKVFKVGNHEERLFRYLCSTAPELLKLFKQGGKFSLQKWMEVEHWEWVESKQAGMLGRLPIFHGHELPRGLASPVNVARGVYLRLKQSAIVGHWHQTSTHVETTGMKTMIETCYSSGCLCDLSPHYAPINRWNHGFTVVEVGDKGEWNTWNRTIDGGVVYATE